MANLRKLFARKEKEPQEKMHGERLGKIFLGKTYEEAQNEAAAYMHNHGGGHELDFAKVYLQTEINKLRLKIDAKRNNLIASAIHYAHKTLNPDSIRELTTQVYKTSLEVCAELTIISFLESKHSHQDKDHCIKAAKELDAAYLQDKCLNDALTNALKFQFPVAKEKEDLESIKEPAPEIRSPAVNL